MLRREDFINRTRRLSAAFIKASDAFNALVAELTYLDLALPAEEGGLGPDDFQGMNSDITREDILTFYSTMQSLLEPLTVEQKKVIYRVKGSDSMVPPPPTSSII